MPTLTPTAGRSVHMLCVRPRRAESGGMGLAVVCGWTVCSAVRLRRELGGRCRSHAFDDGLF